MNRFHDIIYTSDSLVMDSTLCVLPTIITSVLSSYYSIITVFQTCNNFSDLNECDANASTHDCVAMATCNNNNGSFTCTCPNGFTGNGRTNGSRCAGKFENPFE